MEDLFMTKQRQLISDCRIGTLEKRIKTPGAIRHSNGRDVRSDMKVGTMRKQIAKGMF